MEEQNVRLIRGLSPVYPRFITGTASALRCWLWTYVPTPICLCKLFSCKACPGADGGTQPAVESRFNRRTRNSFFLAAFFIYFFLQKPFYGMHFRLHKQCRKFVGDISARPLLRAVFGIFFFSNMPLKRVYKYENTSVYSSAAMKKQRFSCRS